MSAPTVFKGREVEMTEEDLAAEAASFAIKQDDGGDTTESAMNDAISSTDDDEDEEEIPIIKSDIVSSPAGGIPLMEDTHSSRRADSKGKRKSAHPRMGNFPTPKKARIADNSPKDHSVASSADSQPKEKVRVTFRTSPESPTAMPRKTRGTARARKSTRTSVTTSAQRPAPMGTTQKSPAPESGSETDDPASREVVEQELKAAPRRGRPRKTEDGNVNKTIAQGRRRGRPPKTQDPTSSEQSAKDNAKGKLHRISARLRILEANGRGTAESGRSLRSLGKKGDDDKKPPTTHGRGVGRVRKTSNKGREPASTTEYEVEQIVDTKINNKTKEQLYMVKWKGYPSKMNSWEPKKNLNCAKLLKAFHDKHAKSAK
ncbi:hypothetical protein CkaCkLH20_04138 [Colletotrichum karsti]|uniref:Chromo domain-containing protein n=1 Tax=Colletotrichum karsti TaxID=1095194 RepID=A0A9P6IDP3_9PEZI|nr:uncharacterized protein CkaCkLH20_04138 [Colletotrichum karsti]KAF9878646.1 hypothetical protein CkaCkLH20_04138 [Colletotrichum karsti]